MHFLVAKLEVKIKVTYIGQELLTLAQLKSKHFTTSISLYKLKGIGKSPFLRIQNSCPI